MILNCHLSSEKDRESNYHGFLNASCENVQTTIIFRNEGSNYVNAIWIELHFCTLGINFWSCNSISIFFFTAAESKSLKILLSFAVGGLLGDVFLHLLPEAWSSDIEISKVNGKWRDSSRFALIVSTLHWCTQQVVIHQCVAVYGYWPAS